VFAVYVVSIPELLGLKTSALNASRVGTLQFFSRILADSFPAFGIESGVKRK
jgi:hypothetical protein